MKKICCMMVMSLAACDFAQSPVPADAKLEKIATGFQFVEGPVWREGVGLLFSDTDGNTIYQWTPDGKTTTYLKPSYNSNGLTYDGQGRLVLTQMGLRRVSRQELDGTITPLVSTYDGKKFNSPNDIVVKSDGAIFFTDPTFNIPAGQSQELPFSGIFRIGPAGNLELLDSSLSLPNGICFSPDETKLYVNDSQVRIIYVWDVVNDSTLANKRKFASIKPTGYADGMKMSPEGYLFCSGPLGVWVFDPSGTVVDTITAPESVHNCAWGDADRKTLYITAGQSIYRIRLATTGVKEHGAVGARDFELYPNYPNPFNPATTIGYRLSTSGHVRLTVIDLLGREVETLADRFEESGYHAVRFGSPCLSGGIYLARLAVQTDLDEPFIQIKKMTLIK
jgi:gluconolactonase